MAEELARLKEETLVEKHQDFRYEVAHKFSHFLICSICSYLFPGNTVELMESFNCSEFQQEMSPGARNSRIFALENMLATSSSTLVSMASQLSEAEERERAFSGRGRWNQVRTLAEAKNVMNFLFNLASSSRQVIVIFIIFPSV